MSTKRSELADPTNTVDAILEKRLYDISARDVVRLMEARKSYKDSWKKRGGRGAYYNLCRKWDRIEEQVSKVTDDLFTAAAQDRRAEGIMDDIRDLRRYLLLVEEEVTRSQSVPEVRKS